MIKYYNNIDQNTDEWFALRCGVVTASVVKCLLSSKLKIADNETVRTMAYEFAAQKEMKHVEPSPQGYHIIRGHLEEVLARDVYDEHYSQVTECGFITNNNDGMLVGYSPDGLVGDDGLIEIKSRIQKLQMKTIVNDIVPAEYMLQMQTGLYVTGRKWCDFISYSNGMPLFVRRVMPDQFTQKIISEAIVLFYERVDIIRQQYRLLSSELVHCDRVELDFDDDIQIG